MYEKVNPAHPDKVADRIAGAIGDAAAMREALVRCADIINKFGLAEIVKTPMEVICDIEGIITAALSKPPRQCDVGTVEDQLARFDRFCGVKVHCRECVLRNSCSCKFAWAQLPYVDRKKRGVTK